MDQTALYKLSYGVYLLTANENGKDNGCIINTAVQVAEKPARISISVIKGNLTCEMISRTGKFNPLTTPQPLTSFAASACSRAET